jgi:hypothetical protein
MRIVYGSGSRRQVVSLPALSVRAQDAKAHENFIATLQERICPTEMTTVSLRRKGFNVYNH